MESWWIRSILSMCVCICLDCPGAYVVLSAVAGHVGEDAVRRLVCDSVCVMTIGLITLFVKGITHNVKAVGMTAGILVLEYGLMFILIKLGSMALLTGSIVLFLLIALAMYFTLKLKVVNDELTIK